MNKSKKQIIKWTCRSIALILFATIYYYLAPDLATQLKIMTTLLQTAELTPEFSLILIIFSICITLYTINIMVGIILKTLEKIEEWLNEGEN